MIQQSRLEKLFAQGGSMNREDIIRVAKEAGWEMDDSCVLETQIVWYISQGQLERFAALVAAAEREACAKLVDECVNIELLADAIRARGNNAA